MYINLSVYIFCFINNCKQCSMNVLGIPFVLTHAVQLNLAITHACRHTCVLACFTCAKLQKLVCECTKILHSRFSYMPCHELSYKHNYESFGILLGDFGSCKNL